MHHRTNSNSSNEYHNNSQNTNENFENRNSESSKKRKIYIEVSSKPERSSKERKERDLADQSESYITAQRDPRDDMMSYLSSPVKYKLMRRHLRHKSSPVKNPRETVEFCSGFNENGLRVYGLDTEAQNRFKNLFDLKEIFLEAFSTANHESVIFFLKLFVSFTDDIQLLAASALASSYYTIFLFAPIMAITSAQSIFGSQAFISKKYRHVNLYFRQSVLLSVICVVLHTIFPILLIEILVTKLPVNLEKMVDLRTTTSLARRTLTLVLGLLPAMLLQALNLNVITFLQNQTIYHQVGKINF